MRLQESQRRYMSLEDSEPAIMMNYRHIYTVDPFQRLLFCITSSAQALLPDVNKPMPSFLTD